MLLSIIMPVFNAEDTLEKTLRSIADQLSSDVELVVVDDGSTDHTPSILARFALEAGKCCQVFRQDNAGAAAARNTAMDHARGDYLAFVDADDTLSERAVAGILPELEEGVDILGWDWVSFADGKSRRFRQAEYRTAEDALKNLMGGTMKWNLWLFAVRRQMVVEKGIRFLPGSDMGEDMSFVLRAFACSKTVRQLHEALYEYNASNPTSISRQLDARRREEVTRNVLVAERFLLESPFSSLCASYMPHLKLFIKLPLLISTSRDDYRLWYGWFPEANAFAYKNKDLPFRTRFLQWLASNRMWNSVYIYNALYQKAIRLKYR